MIAADTRSNSLAAGCALAALVALLFVAQTPEARADDDDVPFLDPAVVRIPCEDASYELKARLRERDNTALGQSVQELEDQAERSEAEARKARAEANGLDCEHKLSGSGDCFARQKVLDDIAAHAESSASYTRTIVAGLRTLPARLAKAQADYDACLKREAAKKSPPTQATNPTSAPSTASTTPSAPTTPPTPPPPAPPTVVVGPPAGTPPAPLPPVALGPPSVTPPAAPGTLTCYYTDAAGQQKTSFTTSDPEVIKTGCPPNIFPGLILVTAPPGGVSGPLVPPPTPVSPPPSGPVAGGPPPSAGADTCNVVRQRLAWIDEQLALLQGNTADPARAWRTDLETQKVQMSAILSRECDGKTASAGSSSDPSSGLASNPGGPPSSVDPLPPVDIATLLGGVTTAPPSPPPAPLPPITVVSAPPPTTPLPPTTVTPASPGGTASSPTGQRYPPTCVRASPCPPGGIPWRCGNAEGTFTLSGCAADTSAGTRAGLQKECSAHSATLEIPTPDPCDSTRADIAPLPTPPVSLLTPPTHEPAHPKKHVDEGTHHKKTSKPRVARSHPQPQSSGIDPATASALIDIGVGLLGGIHHGGARSAPAPTPMHHHQ